MTGQIKLLGGSAPATPPTNYAAIYVDATGALHVINDAGTDTTISASALASLTDALITSPTNGQVLTYNGTKWVNSASATGVSRPTLTNKSGATASAGMVVVKDGGNDSAYTTTTTADNTAVAGVIVADTNNNASGNIYLAGEVATVLVQGNVTRGNYLSTSTTAGRAKDAGSSKTSATFAIAMTAYSGGGAGSVQALILPSASGAAQAVELIADTTVGAGGVASVDWTSIPSTYKHLRVVCNARAVDAVTDFRMRFNNDSANNYTWSGAGSYTSSGYFAVIASSAYSANGFSPSETLIPDYANTTTHKSTIGSSFYGHTGANTGAPLQRGFIWISTAAINRITIMAPSGNIAEHSRLSLFGIK